MVELGILIVVFVALVAVYLSFVAGNREAERGEPSIEVPLETWWPWWW